MGLDSYLAVNGGKRNTVKPGDIIPMKGVEALVIASHGKFIDCLLYTSDAADE